MKTFCIKTLGCKTNQVEGQIIAQNLTKAGFVQTNIALAQYCIINSCSVTAHTDKQTLNIIKQIKKQKKDVKIVLTGCMAQLLSEKPKDVDIVLGNDEKLDIARHLEESCVNDIFKVEEFHHTPLENATTTRPFVKIQEGCNNRCTYCIIPYARGKSRSNSVENVIGQINSLAKSHKEIVLTGTHIGQWGLEWGKSLYDLLLEIEKSDIHRYRLGSLYVNEITDDIIILLKNSKKFCPHFHLSLQSLCDKTLTAMGRNYSVQEALLLIQKLKSTFVEAFIGCDIIAGFPNESNEDFEETFLNLLKAGVSRAHVFPYSKREGTPAATMEGQIDESLKKTRARKLIYLSAGLYKNFLKENLNKEHEVLFEKKSKKLNLNRGFTRNYIRVLVNDEADLENTLQTLKLGEEHLELSDELQETV